MTALGLLETHGLIGAIAAADAMLKAALVSLVTRTCVGGGLVTITVRGEVAAVRAAVDAGAAAVHALPGAVLVSTHVMARPDDQLRSILDTADPVASAPAATQPEPVATAPARPDPARLKTMGVTALRELARSLKHISMTCEEIRSARKSALIRAILAAHREEE